MGKVIERVIARRLTEALEALGDLDDLQFGFRRKRSTTDAIAKVVDCVRESDSKYRMAILVDFTGSFDNMWWPALIETLLNRGLNHHMRISIFIGLPSW